jgi:hypothetical protein
MGRRNRLKSRGGRPPCRSESDLGTFETMSCVDSTIYLKDEGVVHEPAQSAHLIQKHSPRGWPSRLIDGY